MALEFIQTGNYFCSNRLILFFETILFIWLNPLEYGGPILYPQYHLIQSFTKNNISHE